VADKLTQFVTDALAKAAAYPGGLPLYATKSDTGLFPNTAAAKPAAQKCLADGLVRVAAADTRGKAPRDLYALTDQGWDFLLAQVNPKQVLEDFVRVLEERRGEVSELLDTARRMADNLQGLRDAVGRVLPVVGEARVPLPGAREVPVRERQTAIPAGHAEAEPVPTAVAVLEPEPDADLAPVLLARLADWTGPTDCTLPELYRSLSALDPRPTIGQFHDCLRRLCDEGAVALHSWTGPLYAMPEPAYALLAGHGIAYYASLKSLQLSVVSAQSSHGRSSSTVN